MQASSRSRFNILPTVLRSRLGRQQLVLLMLVVMIPVALLSVNLYINASNTISEVTLNTLNTVGSVGHLVVDGFLSNLQRTLGLAAVSNDLQTPLFELLGGPDLSSAQQTARQALSSYAGAGRTFESMGFYKLDGKLIVGVGGSLPDSTTIAQRPEFTEGAVSGSIGAPFYDESRGQGQLYLAVPVRDRLNDVKGVLFAVATLDELNVQLRASTGIGETEDIYLVSSDGYFLTDGEYREVAGQTEPGNSTAIAAVLRGETGSGRYTSYRPEGQEVFGAYRWLTDFRLGFVAEIDSAEVLPSALVILLQVIPATIVSLLIVLILGPIATNRFVRPIVSLTQVAAQVAIGDFSQRAKVREGDEIGLLASTFNGMADQIQGLISSLEQRVEARTRDLATVTEVNSQISTILETERLLQDVVDLTKERFHLYHAHIYLLDESGHKLALASGAGHVGRQMVSQGRHIGLDNAQSIVAEAARKRQGVIINDVTVSPTFLPNPLLLDTASELAVPLVARGQLLGVLDVQSDKTDYFNDEVLSVMELMAGQIATAISNAQLYEVAARTSRHEKAVGNINRKIQSAVDMDEILQTTVRELGKALRVPYTAIELRVGEENHSTDGESS